MRREGGTGRSLSHQSTWWAALLLAVMKVTKWVLRKVTGKCELLRIINGPSTGAARTVKIEKSCKLSKYPELRRIVEEDDFPVDAVVRKVMETKCIVPEVHPKFTPTFTACVEQILGYRQLISTVQALRLTKYNPDNPEHEEMLERLWDNLMSGKKREGGRITGEWGDIGFQGHDPMTDFRGMGMLGLHDLLVFSSLYPDKARDVLSRSWHPKYGYSFAIVGINLTAMTFDLLEEGRLKHHLYNLVKGKPGVAHYHQVYCYIFTEFDKFWRSEEPESVMAFNQIRDKFLARLSQKLSSRSAVLQANFMVHPSKSSMSPVHA